MKYSKLTKAPTMTDVAKRAGVTIGTVSHVINGTAPISEKTKKRVKKAIDELDYKPNSMARGLRMNKSKMIGLLVPDITNEYYSVVARNFTDAAYLDNYTVMLCSFQYNLDREKLELDVLVDKRVDAIVVFGGSNDDEQILQEVRKLGIPIVLGDRSFDDGRYPSVEFDNKSMVKETVSFLVNKGYNKIGFVTETLTMTNLSGRYSGYIDGMKQNGIAVDERFVYIEEKLQLDKVNNGHDLMDSILKNKSKDELPEVFITTSDLVAIGMIGAIKENGMNVPDDIAVIGYDNLSIASYISPSLTTISQEADIIGNAAWDIVMHVLKKKMVYTPHLLLQQKFIERCST